VNRRLSDGARSSTGFCRDLDGLVADSDVDLDFRISEIHLVTWAVVVVDDAKLTGTPL
jgi:hypothetical protein